MSYEQWQAVFCVLAGSKQCSDAVQACNIHYTIERFKRTTAMTTLLNRLRKYWGK